MGSSPGLPVTGSSTIAICGTFTCLFFPDIIYRLVYAKEALHGI
jgi:hypothetical protein